MREVWSGKIVDSSNVRSSRELRVLRSRVLWMEKPSDLRTSQRWGWFCNLIRVFWFMNHINMHIFVEYASESGKQDRHSSRLGDG